MNASLLARPARACVLISERDGFDWRTLTVAAIAANARTWGSLANVILPVPATPHREDLFWALASALDPDVYVHHQPSWADLSDLAPNAYAKQLAATKRELRRIRVDESFAADEMERPVQPVELPEDFGRQLVARTAPLHNEDEPMYMPFASSGEGIHPLSDAVHLRPLPDLVTELQPSDDPLERLLFAAEFGELSPQLRRDLIGAEVGVAMRPLPNRYERLRWLFGLGGPGWPATPRTLGTQGLEWFGMGPRRELTATIVVGEDLWDFALAYALRCTQSLAWWLPPTYVEADGGIASIGPRFAGLTRKGIRIFITSTSEQQAADELAGALGAPGRGSAAVQRRDWQEVLPERANRLLVRDPAGFPQPLYLQDGMTPRLNTPIPALADGSEELGLRWMTEVSVETGWPVVRHPQLAESIAENNPSSTARTTADGFAYLSPGLFVRGGVPLALQTYRPALQPLSLLEQLEVIAEKAGWNFRFSDKGHYCIGASILFEGLDDLCSALRRPELATVLMAFLDGDRDAPGVSLTDRRRYLSSDEIGELAADDGRLFDELTDRKVLTGGFVLKCPRCRYTAWYRPREVDPVFTCRRCGTAHRVDAASRIEQSEPTWRYQLDETVFQFLRHRGDLALLAASKWFAATRVQSGMVPEVEFVNPEGVKSEIDFVAARGADLWVGEAFTKNRYGDGEEEAQRLDELVAVAELLNARGIVLATVADALREASIRRAVGAAPGPWPMLQILTGCELLPRPTQLLDATR
jgi:hypothetical protein